VSFLCIFLSSFSLPLKLCISTQVPIILGGLFKKEGLGFCVWGKLSKLSMEFVNVRVQNTEYFKKKKKTKQMFAFTVNTGNFYFTLKLKSLSELSV